MRIVAILAVRNEALYLSRCLTHLASQQIESCIIDNSSTDATIEIAESFLKQGVFKIFRMPYLGYYDWTGLLKAKENLSREIKADWFIHCDADEIREAPKPFKNLHDGIIEVDRQGYNAINFDEFVFLPTSDDECFERTDYVALMRYYYFFEAAPLRRINAWKKSIHPVDLVNSGGHAITFKNRKVFPENFIMRHYMVLSRQHAINKYNKNRIYSKFEVEQLGWHARRAKFSEEKLIFPNKNRLKFLHEGEWDKSDPWVRHEIFG
jgi:glycosyltransferase involved in cell wall biosynthesis